MFLRRDLLGMTVIRTQLTGIPEDEEFLLKNKVFVEHVLEKSMSDKIVPMRLLMLTSSFPRLPCLRIDPRCWSGADYAETS